MKAGKGEGKKILKTSNKEIKNKENKSSSYETNKWMREKKTRKTIKSLLNKK